MRKKKFLALLLFLAMVFSCIGSRSVVKAEDNFIVMADGRLPVYNMNPGETAHFKIPVRLGNYNYGISDSKSIMVTVESLDGIFDLVDAVLTRDNTAEGSDIGLSAYYNSNVEFDLTLKETVTIDDYTANINFKFSGYDYSTIQPIEEASLSFIIRVRTEKAPAQLTVDNFSYTEAAAAVGSTFDIKFDAKNEGEITALNTYVSIGYDDGIIPNYTMESVKIGDLAGGQKKSQTFSFKVLPDATPGLKKFTINYTYKNEKGVLIPETPRTVYVNILEASTAPAEDAKLTVKSTVLNAEVNVDTQYELTVELENIGKNTAKNIAVLIPENGGVGADTGILPAYNATGVSVNSLAAGEKKIVSLPILITKNASAASAILKEIKVNVIYEDSEGNIQPSVSETLYITILPEEQAEAVKNNIVISNIVQSPEQPVAGDTLTITFQVTNNGNGDIKEFALYGKDFGNSSFEPLTADIKTIIGELAAGESKEVTMSFRVGNAISEGMNELRLAGDYIDANGEAQTPEFKPIPILNVKQVTQEQIKNSVTIGNISQSPASPVVGENVSISFTVTNNGTKEITDLRFAGANLSSSSFEPVSSQVYTEVGAIPAGGSKNVSMTFKVGSNIPEGFNQLSLVYSYADGNGDIQNENTAVYILDVKNESSVNTSKPKLIVSDFSVDSEELRAGATFNYTFKLKNTHTTKAAKNIKVMVTQAQDIFSATLGSNSFYIDAINPGEEAENTINLKVKSDAATGAYEIKIEVEYEYDDMSQIDANNGGVKDENLIKLQVIENARPTVQNLSIGYGWDTPTVNQATSLMFSFYNMGKSTLDNVYVTLEGDFQMESGTMQIIGSVGAGSSSWQEISIIPTTEGMASGIMVVHFEDSNGDEVTKEFEIPETYVQGEYNYGGGGWDDPGWYDPGFDVGSGDVTEPKKPLMPVWAYILCLVGALGLGTLVSRTVVVKVHKKKLMNAEDI